MTPDLLLDELATLITCLADERYKQRRTEAVDMANALAADECNERLQTMALTLLDTYMTITEDSADRALFLVGG